MFLIFIQRLAIAAFSRVVQAAQAALVEAVIDAFLNWYQDKTQANAAAVNSAFQAWTKATVADPMWDPSKAIAAEMLLETGYAAPAPPPGP